MFTGEFSGLFAPMYKCPKHGEVWHVETVESYDTEYDEVYVNKVCSQCYSEVVPYEQPRVPWQKFCPRCARIKRRQG